MKKSYRSYTTFAIDTFFTFASIGHFYILKDSLYMFPTSRPSVFPTCRTFNFFTHIDLYITYQNK